MTLQFRQGDVLLVKIGHDSESPSDAARIEPDDGRVILAWGEATGHAHVVNGDQAALLEGPRGERYLRVDAPTDLTHEEHAPIRLEPGFYRVIRQRQFVPGRDVPVRD